MTTRSKTSRQPELLSLIKEDHDNVKDMFKQFERSIKGQGKSRAREIGDQILEELEAHAEMEETILYPHLRKQDESLFYEAQEEHHVAKLLISEVRELAADDPVYEAKMLVLRENVEHHIDEEEDQMFAQIRRLAKEDIEEAAEQWQAEKSRRQPQKQKRTRAA